VGQSWATKTLPRRHCLEYKDKEGAADYCLKQYKELMRFDVLIMSDPNVHEESLTDGAAPSKPVSRLTRWYRSPLFNVIIIGLISFTQPGIWNALNSKRCNCGLSELANYC
jgi:hypothetical protein